MSFVESITACFRKYALFSGRARRSEYWRFYLFCTIVSAILLLLPGNLNIISTLFSLAVLVPTLSVSWRRLHDIGKPGVWTLLALIPIVGMIILIIWNCRDSEPGSNEYGPNPKTLGNDPLHS